MLKMKAMDCTEATAGQIHEITMVNNLDFLFHLQSRHLLLTLALCHRYWGLCLSCSTGQHLKQQSLLFVMQTEMTQLHTDVLCWLGGVSFFFFI